MVSSARTGAGKAIAKRNTARYMGLTPRWWLATGLIMAFVGVNLQLLTHITAARWFGIGLIIVGMAKAVYWVTVIEKGAPKARPRPRKDLADRFIHFLTLNGRARPWLPILGIIAILIDLGWNLGYAHSTEFLSQDWTMWALGAVLMAYNFVPVKYGKERDFSLILIFFYTITMVLPMGVYRLYSGTVELPEGFVFYLLASPTSFLVNLTGAYSFPHGIWITFQMTTGQMESLGISTGCAGLDSLFLFISGFIAFVLVENRRLDKRIAAALVTGIFTAYFANLLRMFVIVEAGIHYGRDAMMAVHENAGTLIFLGWIALFWFLMHRFVMRRRPQATEEASDTSSEETLNCKGCGLEIDPDNVPEKCPGCGQDFGEGLFCDRCGAEVDPGKVPERCPECSNPFSHHP